jgi:polysaccharide pyruvyl transferase CsaB
MQFSVSGYYGFGNVGDEAVLAGIRESFARQASDVRLVAFSRTPDETTRLHGISAIDRMNLSVMRQTLKDSDLLLSGGGSLLQDTTSVRSLLYYLWVARLAYSQNVPFMFYAQGMGPLRRNVSRRLVRLVAQRAACLTVRDEPSAQLLESLGIRRGRIEVTADPAFALTPARSAVVDNVLREEGLPADEPMIAVALRPWGGAGESPLQSYADLLTELRAQTGCRVLLLPMHTPHDVAFSEQVAAQTASPSEFPILRGIYSPDVILGLTARMQAVVAMRLHALIFAARTAVPPFALSYDPKVQSLMNGLGLSDSVESWRGFDAAETSSRVALLLAERESRVHDLTVQIPDLERRALRNAEMALTACHNTASPLSERVRV